MLFTALLRQSGHRLILGCVFLASGFGSSAGEASSSF